MHVAVEHNIDDGSEFFPHLMGVEPPWPCQHQLIVCSFLLHLEWDDSHIGVQVQDDEGVGCRHHLAQWVPHVEKLYPGSWQRPEEVQIHHDLVLVLATVLVLGPP